ncbi:MAG: zinc-binding dehydrogenase [Alphaproteobacteria bacterium]|nr:zinc-binding dehydrogenase [Alphaproteobacteria bacterium]
MKAAVIHQFGDFDVLKVEDVQTPKPKPGHVLVKVLAAGVNRLDHNLREGTVVPELPFPHILGGEAVGEVFALGRNVTGREIGERVIVVPGFALDDAEADIRPTVTAPSFALPGLHITGTYAQYIEVPARALVKDETGLGAEEAATLPLVLATAVHAVKGVGRVKAGDKVLVHSGASGSGSMLIQVAKALGAEVATTVRDDAKGAFAKEAGADLVVNTRNEDFVERVKEWTGGQGADVVIDNLGGDVLAKSIVAAKAQGVIVAFGFAAGPEVRFDVRSLFFAQKQLKGSMASDIEDLEWGLAQVKAGEIKPLLDRALPLRDAAEAHRLIANSAVKGNIVLLPWAA